MCSGEKKKEVGEACFKHGVEDKSDHFNESGEETSGKAVTEQMDAHEEETETQKSERDQANVVDKEKADSDQDQKNSDDSSKRDETMAEDTDGTQKTANDEERKEEETSLDDKITDVKKGEGISVTGVKCNTVAPAPSSSTAVCNTLVGDDNTYGSILGRMAASSFELLHHVVVAGCLLIWL